MGGEEGGKFREDVMGDKFGVDSECEGESVNSEKGTVFSGRSFELPRPSKAAMRAWIAAEGAMGTA